MVVARTITPMQPTLVREPFHRDDFAYEEKYDGWRMLAIKDGERVRLVSRNGRDHTERFADIAQGRVVRSTAPDACISMGRFLIVGLGAPLAGACSCCSQRVSGGSYRTSAASSGVRRAPSSAASASDAPCCQGQCVRA